MRRQGKGELLLADRPVIDKQAFNENNVRLLQTLSSNMGVALENARLFNEVQNRNREITETLEQQTATSEVLRAMSGIQPDLRTLLEIIAINVAKPALHRREEVRRGLLQQSRRREQRAQVEKREALRLALMQATA